MIYDLPLTQPIGSFSHIDFEANKVIKEKLESIEKFEIRLDYYNQNIRSLSTFSMEAKIYFEWENPDQRLKIYCGCPSCRALPDFNAEHEQIFFKQRASEVERMVGGINSCGSYREKLAFLFKTKGYIPDRTPKIFANLPFTGNGNPDSEMWLTQPVIDLLPTTKEERIIYNDFVKLDFDKEYKEGKAFSKAYNCFDFKKEKKRFEATLKNAIEPLKLIEYLINKIEKHFGYPENINAEYKENYITKKINKQFEEHGLVTNWFTKMVLGVPIDLNEHVLDTYSLMQHTHVEQVFKFYKYLKGLQTNNSSLTTKKTIDAYDDDICNVPFIGEILHSNLNISKSILDAYYRQVPQPQKLEDVSQHYIGKINRYNSPFQVNYYGAYPLMIDCEMLEYKMDNVNHESGYFKHYQREAVFEALREFAKGFQHGYDNFLKDKITSPTSLSNTEAFKVQKIMDFLSSPFSRGGFSEAYGSGRDVFDEWYNDGVQSGYYYCAWYLILENYQLFEPYFKKETTIEEGQRTRSNLKTDGESQDNIASVDELILWFNQLESKDFEQLIEGLGKLEKYINKNVHEDVKPDLARLKQLNRNLTNWKHQIKSVFIEPIKDAEPYGNAALNEKRTKAITRLENKIAGALEIIHLRINDKEHETVEFEKPIQVDSEANLFCGPMPLSIAKEHFIVFTEQKSRNGKLFLTREQFDLFIQKAFSGKTELPKQRFNQAPHREKWFIVKRFYEFYFMASNEYENTSQCQEKYIKLLTDNFENWEYQDIKNNFSKQVKRNW